jgi:hypothetical protein
MASRNPGRLAIHRRSDEIAFLQHRLRVLQEAQAAHERSEAQVPEATVEECHTRADTRGSEQNLELEILVRERDLADELLHTRQIEPLGETLQRRLAMAERICRELRFRTDVALQHTPAPDALPETGHVEVLSDERDWASHRERLPAAYWVADIERRALTKMLNQWWAWLRES